VLNVLAGDMSLVGPRPLPCAITKALTRIGNAAGSASNGILVFGRWNGRSGISFNQWMLLDIQTWMNGRSARFQFGQDYTCCSQGQRRGLKFTMLAVVQATPFVPTRDAHDYRRPTFLGFLARLQNPSAFFENSLH